ncbi:ArdC family protein [Novosphingobium sp. JCM 18896]|uniref:ArdC family protein n=1 Tax=Novosphingobium sp. JCM 18896 TaxID=2989731 RepID=UPI0022226E81|nr:zincin-like metallopeptidase domain-containing protein [Novosphingobium sp. JCM 18896]MCW1429351.1 zincin-like metallopeptidase domain-containing protein [Novosphingobium sp. JCM 18896]
MRQHPNRSVNRQSCAPRREARACLYDEVTSRILAELAEGRLPWVQPWGLAGATGAGLPRNAASRRPYSGINVLILWSAVIAGGYPSQGWLTFRQAQDLGGSVRRGEKGTGVVYADRFTPESEKARALETGGEARDVPFLKRFTLFNVAQCDGLPERIEATPAPLPEREIVVAAEEVVAASGIDFRIGGDKAFYRPSADFVQVPPQPLFFDQINFYRTVFHELTHATGHASRLARPMDDPFGSPGYAREELVAEMGSAFVCAALGIVPTVRHSDYIGAWFEVLSEDNRAIFRAASQASKAADWLLGRHAEAKIVQGRAGQIGDEVADGEFEDTGLSAAARVGDAA